LIGLRSYAIIKSSQRIADFNRDIVYLAEDELGLAIDQEAFEEAKDKVRDWSIP
jgi:hypothetical protein